MCRIKNDLLRRKKSKDEEENSKHLIREVIQVKKEEGKMGTECPFVL